MKETTPSFYEILGVPEKASQEEIRNAYRQKSKQFHPDTTLIDKAEAAQKFQILNQAYDTLRFPEQRQTYDAALRGGNVQPRFKDIRRSPQPQTVKKANSSAFLDSADRPLSAGEIFALFILGVTFLACLLLALFLGVSRGEVLIQSFPQDSSLMHQLKNLNVLPQSDLNSSQVSSAAEGKDELKNPSRVHSSQFSPRTQRQRTLFATGGTDPRRNSSGFQTFSREQSKSAQTGTRN